MPRPHYILCCQSVSEDKRTGLISHFHVIEKIRLHRPPTVEGQPGTAIWFPPEPFVVVAVWKRCEDDPPEQEYEFQTVLFLPPNGTELRTAPSVFRFSPDKMLFRVTLRSNMTPPMEGSGILRAESWIRPVGSDGEWMKQDYLIPVEGPPPDEAKTPSEVNPSPA
jgi:hypothetical protein